MKKGRIFTNSLLSIWTMCLLAALASCSADSDNVTDYTGEPIVAEAPFSVILKAYSENEDITSRGDVKSTTLYVFDQNNDFYKQIVVDETYPLQAKPVQIDCPGSDKITVVAWSGLSSSNAEISYMSEANIISDLQISLKQNNGVVNNFPEDLFYGQVTLKRNNTKATTAQPLKISRKVASLSLTTKGILKVYDSKEGSFFYKVKKTKSSINYNGELTGNDVEYIIPATLNEKGVLVAETTPILPASNISVELYKNNELIFSGENLKNNENVSVNEGEQVCATFDVSKKSCDIIVSSWGTVIQRVVVE